MVVTIAILVTVLGIVVGYATRQREELRETHDRIERLLAENERLRATVKSHEFSLEMVLGEIEKTQ